LKPCKKPLCVPGKERAGYPATFVIIIAKPTQEKEDVAGYGKTGMAAFTPWFMVD
jgi:hypothetical protein